MTRVPLVDIESLPDNVRETVETSPEENELPAEYTSLLPEGAPDIFLAIANHPPVVEAFRELQSVLWHEIGLSPVERELVILSVAREHEMPYEWHHHVRVALGEGIDPDTIRAVSNRDYSSFDAPSAALIRYAQAFVQGEVDDTVHEELTRHYDPEIITGIGLLAGFYSGTAETMKAFDMDLEVPFVGWELENL